MSGFTAQDALRHAMKHPEPTIRPPKTANAAPSSPAKPPLPSKTVQTAPERCGGCHKPKDMHFKNKAGELRCYAIGDETFYPAANYKKYGNTDPESELHRPEHPQPEAPLEGDCQRKAPGAACPLVRFTLYRYKHLLDVDAKYGSIKDLLDGLQYAGLIHGDKEGQISLEVNQVKVPHKSDQKTVIQIIPAPSI